MIGVDGGAFRGGDLEMMGKIGWAIVKMLKPAQAQ